MQTYSNISNKANKKVGVERPISQENGVSATLKVGLIGYPLSHSVSPPMQQAAFDAYAIKAVYSLWETGRDKLPQAVARLRLDSYLGANVTVPYKEAVLPLLDDLTSDARSIGAVNTIVNQGGRLSGHNTDAPGFLMALKKEAGFDPKDKSVVLLGAGGVARAVAFALIRGGAGEITIVNRTITRAEELAEALGREIGGSTKISTANPDYLSRSSVLADCDLVVNGTSIGLEPGHTPLPADLIPRQALIYDLIYRPTRLLMEASEAGAQTLDGLSMLIYQGALAFELWTGRKAPVQIMREAARIGLNRESTCASQDLGT